MNVFLICDPASTPYVSLKPVTNHYPLISNLFVLYYSFKQKRELQTNLICPGVYPCYRPYEPKKYLDVAERSDLVSIFWDREDPSVMPYMDHAIDSCTNLLVVSPVTQQEYIYVPPSYRKSAWNKVA